MSENPRGVDLVVTGEVPPVVARKDHNRRGGAEATACTVGRRRRTSARRVRTDGRSREGWWVIIAESEARATAKGEEPRPRAPTENRTGEWRLGSTVDWGKLKYQTKPAAGLETSPLSLFLVLSNGFGPSGGKFDVRLRRIKVHNSMSK